MSTINPLKIKGVTKENDITVYPTCNPKCCFFPCVDCYDWTEDSEGVKHRTNKNFNYICGYDGHKIKNWREPCPLYLVKLGAIIEKDD